MSPSPKTRPLVGTKPVLSLACLVVLSSCAGCASSHLRIRGRSTTRFERASTHFIGQDLALLVDLQLRERVRSGFTEPPHTSDHDAELAATRMATRASLQRREPACLMPPLCRWEQTQVSLALSTLAPTHTTERTP